MIVLEGGFGPNDEKAPALRLPDELWDSENDDALICQAVRQETHDVRTFVLRPVIPRRIRFQPGQFMTYAFEIGGETLHRCYTISSAPSRPDCISITVKRVPGGPVSNWLHDNLKPGMQLKALGPMGAFTCYAHPAPRYLFLSGGSGVTPLMSMARTFHDLGEQEDIVFVHSARTPADVIFGEELELMSRMSDKFRFVPVVEGVTPLAPFIGLRGRISSTMLEMITPDYLTREVFVCGPAPYMAAVREQLARAGFDMNKYHEESFNFDALPAADKSDVVLGEAMLEAAPDVKTYKVEFSKTRRAISVPENMTVLEAAKRAGMRLPSSCTQGLCGTCKSKKLSGTVDMHHQGGIRQREIDAGMVLLCCSRPTSDLVIER
ncbi:MAG: 2Fe-2S iron-sulfur cluster-binding protein [Devosia sp.]